MHPFPRIHPLAHKSRVRADESARRFGDHAALRPWDVTLQPGEVLYIPPYTWHSVESLTPSASLATWSEFANVRGLMQHMYRTLPHEFDLLDNRRGRMFAARTYIDLLLQDMFGPVEGATQFVGQRLLPSRYRGLEALFPSRFRNITASERIAVKPMRCQRHPEGPGCGHDIGAGAWIDASQICDNPAHPGSIPVKEDIVQAMQMQVDSAASLLRQLPSAAVRDVLLADYIEEIAADVVGAERALAFLQYCFKAQPYHVTRCHVPDSYTRGQSMRCDSEQSLWSYFSAQKQELPSDLVNKGIQKHAK